MSLPQTVAEVISKHVTLELESIDRMYLNLYIPRLQYERGVASFFRFHRGHTFASSALMAPISRAFVRKIETFVEESGVPLIRFQKNQRRDDVAAEHLARFSQEEGVLFVGKAQEKTPVFMEIRQCWPCSVRCFVFTCCPEGFPTASYGSTSLRCWAKIPAKLPRAR